MVLTKYDSEAISIYFGSWTIRKQFYLIKKSLAPSSETKLCSYAIVISHIRDTLKAASISFR